MTAAEQPRWRRRPELRPGQILDAALGVFSEEGLEAARLEDIASRAGVSKATIYLYFPSKTELFREVVHRAVGELVAVLEGSAEGASARDEVVAFTTAFWRQLRSPAFYAVYRLVLAEMRGFPELGEEYAREIRRPVTEVLHPILDRGVAAGEFTAGDTASRARMLLALVIKHAVWCARREYVTELQGKSDDDVLAEVLGFYLAGLGA
jgi:AcrR family transcriptional regulator